MKKVVRIFFLTGLLFCFSSSGFCQYESIKPQGIYSSDFVIDGIPRSITYYMPLKYDKLDSYPLLIFLHDEKSNAKNVIKKYGDLIHAKADSADCIVMYPDAVAGHWNTNANSDAKDSVNDVGFISIMLGFFIQQYHCDADRIYIFGIGAGGNMCYNIKCGIANHLAAVATVNATNVLSDFQHCRNHTDVPHLDIIGETNIQNGISKAWQFLLSHHTSE